MNKLIFNKLYIFSPSEKKAKVISFSDGINIVTSSKKDGNKKGKSILLKSLYHTLGADCYFDDRWETQNKTYILDFNILDKKYIIYRFDRLFKVFSEGLELIFNTVDRSELSEFLASIYNFSVELPSRNNDQLELTPPAFSYLLNYIDQDKMDGTYFTSFKSLGQFLNFKENLLYCHFGVFDKNYYEVIKKLDSYKEKERIFQKDKDILDKMISKVLSNIDNNTYSKNLEILKIEVDKAKDEYTNIAYKLNTTKKSLIKLRNEKHQLLMNIEELNDALKGNKKELKSIINHICPLCKSEMEDNLNFRIKKYSLIEDLILLSNELESSILKIDIEIKKQEESYKKSLELLNKYDKSLKINTKEINDVLKHKGFIEINQNLNLELSNIKKELETITLKIKQENDKKRAYDKLKSNVNKKYCELMTIDKQSFDLQEIDSKNFENIKNVFVAGGSNKPISTVIWYFNLLRIKQLFNPNSIRFPLVLDSPNNVELDDDKRQELFRYLFNNIDKDTQLIVSTLGFDKNDYPDVNITKIIELENNKYELLNDLEYQENIELLINLSKALFNAEQ